MRVESESEDVVARLGQRFRMFATEAAALCAVFTAHRSGAEYRLEPGPLLFDSFQGFMQHLEYEILNAFVLALPQFLWMHAGAAARGGRAILIAGSSGCGKSTIVTGLCQRGWDYLSDDTLPLEAESRSVHAFLRGPWFRLPSDVALPPERIIELKKRNVDLDALPIALNPAVLAMVVFPTYGHGAPLVAERLSGAAVALNLASCIVNFGVHGAQGLAFLAAVARDVPAWRLEYSDRRQAIEWVDRTFRDHARG